MLELALELTDEAEELPGNDPPDDCASEETAEDVASLLVLLAIDDCELCELDELEEGCTASPV